MYIHSSTEDTGKKEGTLSLKSKMSLWKKRWASGRAEKKESRKVGCQMQMATQSALLLFLLLLLRERETDRERRGERNILA